LDKWVSLGGRAQLKKNRLFLPFNLSGRRIFFWKMDRKGQEVFVGKEFFQWRV